MLLTSTVGGMPLSANQGRTLVSTLRCQLGIEGASVLTPEVEEVFELSSTRVPQPTKRDSR
jgi:hypothetical protein